MAKHNKPTKTNWLPETISLLAGRRNSSAASKVWIKGLKQHNKALSSNHCFYFVTIQSPQKLHKNFVTIQSPKKLHKDFIVIGFFESHILLEKIYVKIQNSVFTRFSRITPFVWWWNSFEEDHSKTPISSAL